MPWNIPEVSNHPLKQGSLELINDQYFLLFSDIRPTFLFWARGGPVALLRGANRPLLTRLIQEEVAMEYTQSFRPPPETRRLEIDYSSPRVIQCIGDLAQLANDDVIRSIGSGNTEKLSSFYQGSDSNVANSNHDTSCNTTEITENTMLQSIDEGIHEKNDTDCVQKNDTECIQKNDTDCIQKNDSDCIQKDYARLLDTIDEDESIQDEV